MSKEDIEADLSKRPIEDSLKANIEELKRSLESGDFEKAERLITEAVKQKPNAPESLILQSYF